MGIFSRIVFVLLIVCFHTSVAQKSLLKQLDTVLVEQNRYIANYDRQSFMSSDLIDQVINPQNIDKELAGAVIFYTINKWREKKRKVAYRQNSKLDRIAYVYSNHYTKFRFKHHADGYYKLKKTIRKVPRYLKLDFTYLEGYLNLPVIVDYERGSFYYNEELGSSENDLYLGEFSKEDNFQEEPIASLTYRQFGERVLSNLIKNKSGSLLRSKAYELMAVRVADLKKIKSKSIPRVKVIYLIGGYRTKLID